MIKINEIAIIIVNLNGRHLLPNCFLGLQSQSYSDFDLYFVDNNSTDTSVEYVQQNFPQAEIIQLPENNGFAKANNIAIKKALLSKEVKYIVCLNNDTLVDKDWLKELVSCISSVRKEERVGMVASKSYFPNGLIQNAGIEIKRDGREWYIEAVARGAGIDDKSVDTYNKKDFILGPSGNSALYTREMLENVGLFDEDFFAYMEDVDLAMRGQAAGYKCLYNNLSTLIHFHSQTSKASSPLKAYLSKRNTYFMAIKNFSFLELITFPIREFVSNVKGFLKRGKGSSMDVLERRVGIFGIIKIMLKVYFSVLVLVFKFLKKRWKIEN